MPGPRRFPLPLIAAFFALYVIWGSTYLVIRIGVEYWPPLLLAGIRFCTAGALMYGYLRWRGVPAPTWKQWKAAGMIGILLLTFGNGGVSVAEHTGVSSGVAALAVATVPLFTLLCGYFWGARNTRLEWAGVILGIVGIAMLNMGSTLQSSPIGAALLLFAAASWAFGSVWSRQLPLPQGAMASAAEMLVAGVALLLGSALSGEHLQALPPPWRGDVAAARPQPAPAAEPARPISVKQHIAMPLPEQHSLQPYQQMLDSIVQGALA